MRQVVGVDVGTMFIVAASQKEKGKIAIRKNRNNYLEISDDVITHSEVSDAKIDYIRGEDDGKIYVVGEDAYKFGNLFNQPVNRPMQDGVIKPGDMDAVDILTMMIQKLVGKQNNGLCVYSVPADPIDSTKKRVFYHETVFGRIFKSLGYESIALNEAMAVIYSDCSKEQFSGIGISFGSGLTNICCAYKGTPVLTFSVERGGDWIDNSVANSLGLVSNKVTSIKEKPDVHLIDPVPSKNKKEKRIREAIQFYYDELIKYTIDSLAKKIIQSSNDIGEPIPIVVSGGTSNPAGFLDLFKQEFKKYEGDFPFEVKEIRHAKNPLDAVAAGCLFYALSKDDGAKNEEIGAITPER